MKGKGIWILIIVLAVVLIALLLMGGSNQNRSALSGGVGTGGGASDLIDQLAQTTQGIPSAKDCNKDCKTLCDIYPKKILCKDRCQCRRACEADCVKGLDYRALHPQ